MFGAAKLKEALYKRSPSFVQNGLLGIYGWQLRNQRFGPEYKRQLAYLAAREVSDPRWLEAERKRELARLLNHCREGSPHYAALLPSDPVTPEGADAVLAALPFLDKETLRERIESIRTIDPGAGVVANTGGTTGASLQVVYRKQDIPRRFAVLHHFQAQFGVDPVGDSKATFSGRELLPRELPQGARPWRDNKAYNQRLYSTFHLHGGHLDAVVADLAEYQPAIVNGFVSAVSAVARRILAEGQPLSWSPRAIFTTSEMLSAHDRDDIERAFGAKVRDQYGSAEGAPVVTECLHGRMHLNTFTGMIEAVEVEGRMQACVTSFTNTGTPLLRYLIGDAIELAEGTCPCGSREPLVGSIEGRSTDFLYAADGAQVSASHLSDVIKGIPNSVRRVKFTQHRVGDLLITAEIDRDRFSDDDLGKLRDSARYRFGAGTEIEIEFVDRIPLAASGKFRMIDNRVPRP